jgi:hypothetical protein
MGVYFRSSDGADSNNAYVFHISANGYYTYFKYVGGSLNWLAGTWISHAAINQGLNVWNTLKVVANGNTFDLYCNETLLTTFTDSSHSSGKAGLKAYDTSSDSDIVEFDDVSLTCWCCHPFKENFDDGVADDWWTDGSGKWAVNSGVYKATGAAGGSAYLYSHYNGDSADFVYKARLRMTSGDSGRAYGIRFRSDGTNENRYGLNISNTGSYLFYKQVGGGFSSISGWTSSPAINTGFGVWNTLKVEANGNSFTLYCNGTQLGTWTDSSLTAGKPGLSVYEGSVESVVEFDDVSLSCGGVVITPILHLLLLD